MTLVKICGITNLEDALCAVDAGAGALGFNFYSPSPRYIDPENAREIIEKLPKRVLTVGVFVNEEPERLKSIANGAGVTALQLHVKERRACISSTPHSEREVLGNARRDYRRWSILART